MFPYGHLNVSPVSQCTNPERFPGNARYCFLQQTLLQYPLALLCTLFPVQIENSNLGITHYSSDIATKVLVFYQAVFLVTNNHEFCLPVSIVYLKKKSSREEILAIQDKGSWCFTNSSTIIERRQNYLARVFVSKI